MTAHFDCNLAGSGTPLPHFWEHTVGSGHATLALRSDWQAHLRRAHIELGMRHVRFHGILDDDMGTLICQNDKLLYSFFNADQIIDFLLSIGMRPFVELSFMPSTLSSGDQIVFHYRANVTKPRDLGQWGELMRRLVGHWVDRYGIDEVRQWYFEVWNEPNLTAFGNGQIADYFQLFETTFRAIKSVDSKLNVGGPATAANAWIVEFLQFCAAQSVPPDFISTHHYPTDAFGKPGDHTEAQLAASPRSILRQEAREVRQKAGLRPVFYTEWCTSSNPRDRLHDEPFAAAFIIKTVLEANGLVDGYSYWTFSDIFEENYFPSTPFHGGFGLQTIHGIAKPAYRAFQMLHDLGTEMRTVNGHHDTVDAWLIASKSKATIMLTNYNAPRQPIATENVTIALAGAGVAGTVRIRRIDTGHANAKGHWIEMGQPEYLSKSQVETLHEHSQLVAEPAVMFVTNGSGILEVQMPPQSVASIELELRPTNG